MNWRNVADWAKRRPITLKAADRLGRSRGRLAALNGLDCPPKPRLKPDLSNWDNQELAAIWIGHATVLLRIGGLTILTDPVFSSRVGVGLGLMTVGPTRLAAPALNLSELPPIDLLLISHAHFDHLDRPSLSRLPKKTPVITAPHTADLLSDLGFRRVQELAWGQTIRLNGVSITAVPAVHWGARTFHDTHRGYNSYLIDDGQHRVLYGGDTAYHEGYRAVDPVDLAILGIGAYDPYVAAHATPEQAIAMADHCRAKFVLPIHHSTFRLSYEPTEQPMQRLLAASLSNPGRIVVREIGGQWANSPSPAEHSVTPDA